MTFGQQSGPPASPRQVQQLLALLKDAGHTDFRDARGPMGFTQRQAGGKFTRDEAAAFIDQLQDKELGTACDRRGPGREAVRTTTADASHAGRTARCRASTSRLDRHRALEGSDR